MRKSIRSSFALLALAWLWCALLVLPGQALAQNEQNMYRLYNQWTGEHFYTAQVNERDSLAKVGWTYEGVGWVAPTSGDPVYRLYNSHVEGGDHHYTMSAEEKDALVELGWTYEGIGWYSGGSVKVYREYNPYAQTGTHNYTTSQEEHSTLVSLGWHDEGIGWYGTSEGWSVAPSQPPASSGSSSGSSSGGSVGSGTVDSGIVYWTPNGETWHSRTSCPSLSRSKTILSGTIAQAQAAGKGWACHNCC